MKYGKFYIIVDKVFNGFWLYDYLILRIIRKSIDDKFTIIISALIKSSTRGVSDPVSSVIRQKGESQNGCFKKAKNAKISEKQTFLTS